MIMARATVSLSSVPMKLTYVPTRFSTTPMIRPPSTAPMNVPALTLLWMTSSIRAASEAMVRRTDSVTGNVRIAIVGKYVQLEDAYKSVIEALEHGGIHHGVSVEIDLVDSENLDPEALEGLGERIHLGPLELGRADESGGDVVVFDDQIMGSSQNQFSGCRGRAGVLCQKRQFLVK